MLKFILIVSAAGLIALILTVIMVTKFYWGPTGLPPKQRYQKKESEEEPKNPL